MTTLQENTKAKRGIAGALAALIATIGVVVGGRLEAKHAKANTTNNTTIESTTEDNQISSDFMGNFDITNDASVLNRATLIYNSLTDKKGITIADIMNIIYIYNGKSSKIAYPSNCTTDAQKIKYVNGLAVVIRDRLCNRDAEEKSQTDASKRFYIVNLFAKPSKDVINFCNFEKAFYENKSKENVDALIASYKNLLSSKEAATGEKAAAIADMSKLVYYKKKTGYVSNEDKKTLEDQNSNYDQEIYSKAK